MSLILAQLPYVLKFYVIGRFFVHLFMALGMTMLITHAKNVFLKSIILLACIAAFATLFVTNSAYWKHYLMYRDIYTHISPFEVDAAKFLKEQYGTADVLLISDPATQYILETLSHVNSPGGAYADSRVREKLINIDTETNSDNTAKHLYAINDAILPTNGKRIFALSGRYFLWQKSSLENKQAIYFNIWYPADLTYEDIQKVTTLLEDTTHFKLVYYNPTVVIVEVTP